MISGPGERIESIDVLRGVAVLGILAVNMPIFGLHSAEVMNPFALGSIDFATYCCWLMTYVFFDSKFVAIFSMLFGAGIVMMYQRNKVHNRPYTSLHFRRMFWLLIIGLLHAHLMWHGDILTLYALSGFIVWWLSGLKARYLLALGAIFYLIGNGFYFLLGHTVPRLSPEDLAEVLQSWTPTPEKVDEEYRVFRGSWWGQIPTRSGAAFGMETLLFLVNGFWKAGGLMLMGMALYKSGVLSGEKNKRFYFFGATFGIIVGLVSSIWGIIQIERHNWEMLYTQFFGFQYNWISAPLMAFGYLCLTNIWCKSDVLLWLRNSIGKIGKLSLSNYLLQTLICTTFFYGHGLGWYGHLGRLELAAMVLIVWGIQYGFSTTWTKLFRFGPMEWVWRSLSHWEKQSMKS